MKLLDAFEAIFSGHVYKHRSSTVGDALSVTVFEDLYDLGRSRSYVDGVESRDLVVNTENKVTGRRMRRGDGTFGERLVSVDPALVDGFDVARGKTADVRIGVEVKILATAMIKQIDRVIGDLRKQARQFESVTPNAMSIALVGVNRAETYRSYEGPDRSYDKPGRTGVAPATEADDAVSRLLDGTNGAASAYDEFLILDFSAPNVEPFPFDWFRRQKTADAYAAVLQRVSTEYERRFGG